MGTSSDMWVNAGRKLALYTLGSTAAGLLGGAVGWLTGGAAGGFTATVLAGLDKFVPSLLADKALDGIAGRVAKAGELERDVLANHDVARLVGRAIQTCLKAIAKEAAGSRGDVLRKMAATAPATLPRMIQAPARARLTREEIEGMTQRGVVDLLRHSAEQGTVAAIDATVWNDVLRYLALHARCTSEYEDLDDAARHDILSRLARSFPTAVIEHLKQDADSGRAAYAAVSMEVWGRILEAQDAIRPALGDLAEKFDDFIAAARTERQRVASQLDRIEKALHPELPLDMRQRLSHVQRYQTLTARNRLIPLIGRERQLHKLWSWVQTGGPVSLATVTGPGGVGKTRLAQQLCDDVRGSRWRAGFVSETDLDTFQRAVGTTWVWDRPTLVVVDYAGTRVAQLEQLLSGLARRHESLDDLPSLRILLIDRQGTDGARGAGLGKLLAQRTDDAGVVFTSWWDAELDSVELEPFAASDEASHARKILAETLRIEAGRPADALPEFAATAARLHDLTRAMHFAPTPLLLQLAVLMRTEIETGRAKSKRELLASFWRRERSQHLVPIAEEHGVAVRDLEALVVVASLRQGISRDDLAALHAHEVDPAPAVGRVTALADALENYLGGADEEADATSDAATHILPVEPDLVAEFVTFRWLTEVLDTPNRRASWLRRHVAEAPDCCKVLVRAAQDFPDWDGAWRVFVGLVEEGSVPAAGIEVAVASLPQDGRSLHVLEFAIRRAWVEAARCEVGLDSPSPEALRAASDRNLDGCQRLLARLSSLGETLCNAQHAGQAIPVHLEEVRLKRALAGLSEGCDDLAIRTAVTTNVTAVLELGRGRYFQAMATRMDNRGGDWCSMLVESERLLEFVVKVAPLVRGELDVVQSVRARLCPPT
ncbi:MAG: hypothetical protein JNL08_12930 [Planctomycetes bacterium]|nr:hypothetical protein [Planctomycetota bacterium]